MLYKITFFLAVVSLFSACTDEHPKEVVQEDKQIQTSNKREDVIPWVDNIDEAFELTKNEHKNIIIMAVSDGCRWCDRLKEESLSNPKVLKQLERYILVQADRETPEERAILPQFRHVPVLFFATPEREFYDDLRGYYNAEDLLSYLNEVED